MTRRRAMDVVVVGGGPAGLAAAAAAATGGRQVLLIDQGRMLGGQIWRHRRRAELSPQAEQLLDRVRSAGVTIASEARVIDAPSAHELVVDFRGRVDVQRAEQLILATGAVERFVPFPGWTLPGVTGVGGLQALLKSGLTVTGTRVVVAGSGPLLWPVAATVIKSGARLGMIAEQASRGRVLGFGTSLLADPDKLLLAAQYRWATLGTPFRTGSWVVRAEGDDRVREVVLSVGGRERRLPCDWLASACGLVPNTELATAARLRPRWRRHSCGRDAAHVGLVDSCGRRVHRNRRATAPRAPKARSRGAPRPATSAARASPSWCSSAMRDGALPGSSRRRSHRARSCDTSPIATRSSAAAKTCASGRWRPAGRRGRPSSGRGSGWGAVREPSAARPASCSSAGRGTVRARHSAARRSVAGATPSDG
ncbi:MAG: FAD/NAD(P)-binding oxidoreductase [Gemmatimonadales bacterium]